MIDVSISIFDFFHIWGKVYLKLAGGMFVCVCFFLKNTKVKLVELLLLIFTEIQKNVKCMLRIKETGYLLLQWVLECALFTHL